MLLDAVPSRPVEGGARDSVHHGAGQCPHVPPMEGGLSIEPSSCNMPFLNLGTRYFASCDAVYGWGIASSRSLAQSPLCDKDLEPSALSLRAASYEGASPPVVNANKP